MKNFGPWRIIITALICGIVTLFGWSLFEANNLGKVKVDRTEFERHEVENREDFKEVKAILREQKTEINQKVDEIKTLIINLQGE